MHGLSLENTMRPAAFIVVAGLIGSAAAQPPPYSERYAPPPYAVDLPDNVRWQELLLRPTSERGIDVVQFQGKGGRVSWIRISPARGLHRVDVEYANQPIQSFWADRWARGRDQIIEIDRRDRVRRVVIFSRPGFSGTYRVFGARA
jgi:hypothetical protein